MISIIFLLIIVCVTFGIALSDERESCGVALTGLALVIIFGGIAAFASQINVSEPKMENLKAFSDGSYVQVQTINKYQSYVIQTNSNTFIFPSEMEPKPSSETRRYFITWHKETVRPYVKIVVKKPTTFSCLFGVFQNDYTYFDIYCDKISIQ